MKELFDWCYNNLPLILSFSLSIAALRLSLKANIINKKPQLVFLEHWEAIPGVGNKSRLSFMNIGFGPAFNITIADEYISKYKFLEEFKNLPRNIAPNGTTLFAEAAGNFRYIQDSTEIEIIYEDHEGRSYRARLAHSRHSFSPIGFRRNK